MRANVVSARGTTVQKIDVQSPNWAGEAHLDYQQEKLNAISENQTITMCKGTACVKVENLRKPRPSKIYSIKGCTIVTNRGTGSRIL